MVGMVDLLSKTEISEEQLYYIDGLKSSSRHLLNIVNDLLDLKKLQARQLTLVNEPFDLNAILDSLREIFAFQAGEKGITFTIFKQKEVPVSLSGDSHRLEQILQNLLSNAIKFTDTGDIRLDIVVDNLSEHDIRLGFTVSDTGLGIEEDKLDKVFDSFYQAHDFKKDEIGSGLGLAIVKALVELQKGEVFVKSSPGQGSTFGFYITYPLIKEVITEEEEKEATIEITGKDRPLNILVADDEEVNTFIAKRYLETSGIEVIVDTANNGKAVIDRFNEKTYDIIIMDLRMPYMSGYEAAVFIRDKFPEPKCKTPILLLTASTLADDDPCLKYINDYLLKPFQREDLYEKIQEMIG